ncbi:hypothetical protein CGLAMM_03400 [Acetobacteraceae bacterium EV16G]|uniref:Adenosylcobinamide-GDP ribazoletransferase n=1 Tax=Sorlinia euscelidii TaxID=3081148 RepID=A0ABU7U2U3_9PROT
MSKRTEEFRSAWMLLTRIPLARDRYGREEAGGNAAQKTVTASPAERVPLAKTVWAWPVIGGLIGAFSALLILVLVLAGVDLSLAVLWVVAAQFLITGALHEDGLMDAADGLFGGRNPERRLAIMRDSRVGSFGVLAGVLASLGKWSAYLAICRTASFDMVQTVLALAAAAAFGRLGMVQVLSLSRPARSNGMASGIIVAKDKCVPPILISLVIGLGVGVIPTAMALLASGLLAMGVARYAQQKIGGYTGDILGATAIIIELATLTIYSATGGDCL